jgi:hypothetical protein
MVEVPKFSVHQEVVAAGAYLGHTFFITLGEKVDGGYAVHPAFVKPDGSYRDHFYVGAYQGTGANGNGSTSGVGNTIHITRPACRAACRGRGAGWHQFSYWERNALQWLLITEYQDMNSQKVLGNGAVTGGAPAAPTGPSNVRGNRSGQAHTGAGAASDYVSYRGVENLYGRMWQWVDGCNVNERNVYLCTDPSKWTDDTATGYISMGTAPASGGSYQRDVMNGVALLPSSVTGASDTTYMGDGFWTSTGWRVASTGGSALNGGLAGALSLALSSASGDASNNIGGRLSWHPA